jgi:hypothetical protein
VLQSSKKIGTLNERLLTSGRERNFMIFMN